MAAPFTSGSALTCAAELHVWRQAPLSTPYWTPRSDAARYDFEPGRAVRSAVPADAVPRHFALSIGGADVSVERTSSIATATCSPARSGWNCRSSRHSTCASRPISRWCRASAPRRRLGARRTPGRPRAPSRSRSATTRKVPVAATASLQLPDGWRVDAGVAPVKFEREDEDGDGQVHA